MKIRRKAWKTGIDTREMGRYAVFVLVIFSVVILVVLGYSLLEMRRASMESTTNYVQNLTEQLTIMVDLEISRGRQQLASVGDSFEQVVAKKDAAAVEEFITRKQKLCGFDFIALEDIRSGRLVTAGTFPEDSDAAAKSLKEMEVSRLAAEEKICKAGIENENVIYAMPLYDGSEQIGFLWAGNTAESMRELIQARSFQERSYSCIIDKNGDLVLSADKREEFQNLEAVFKKGDNEELQKSMREMEQNIAEDQSGIFRFVTEDRQNVYLAYTPMSGGNRVMLTIIPTDIISTDYDDFVRLAALSVLGTMLVFMGFVILLTRSYRSNRKKLEHLAYTDEVTGGGNNQDFCVKFKELCRNKAVGEYAVVLMDVVNFKAVNKKLGVKQGDAMLRYLYTVICGSLDTKRGEFAARTEMDHFFLCLQERDPESVQRRLDAIIEKINSFAGTQLPRYPLSFRMAASFVEGETADPIVLQDRIRSVMKLTDAAPGKCAFHSRAFEEQIRKDQELESAFEAALAAEEFQVYFQPKVSLEKGRVEGAEALVRWQRPGQGLVPPCDFIPMLEGNGKILLLDRYVFEKVCIWLAKRQDAGEQMVPVSVNLSRSHLLDKDFFTWFVETADRYGVRHDLIEFELTESTFMVEDQIQQMRDYILRMHELGFRVSIDDFGTGYSSISLLKEFDVDVLKLDRTFFLDLDDPKARDVIKCLTELAKKLSIRIVVEGIESKKQIEYLKDLSCDVVQGYFFSKPLPENVFSEWYRRFTFKEYGV